MSGESRPAAEIAADLFRREGARLVATLTAHLGTHRLQLAEDVVQEALVRALQTWPFRGIPENPAAWLTLTAKNLALDLLRREQNWHRKETGISAEHERWLASPALSNTEPDAFTDDTLRLMFVCFHPQLSVEVQTALALRTLCSLSPAEIASAFLTTEAAIAKRLVRARQKIRDLAIPFVIPDTRELPERLNGVLGTLYLLFNEGYKASTGDQLVRADLCHEAIRLASLLTENPATRTPAAHALLALMLFNAARLPARTDDAGNLLRLHEQNRGAWDRGMIASGIRQLGLAAVGDQLSAFHLEAGIAACHSTAPDDVSTDWPRILSLYDQLLAIKPSPITALNRAVAVARVRGPGAGLAALDEIHDRSTLGSYHLYHAIRGSLLAETGRMSDALVHFRQAGNLATLPAERDFIARRITECGGPDPRRNDSTPGRH
ncbi:MAG: sigma-70 family RNA polymerase sigma factor [Opitutaceae bacterium]|nr:sigma-70 family RNA polymerase sigma factor [Opitutaceae bacterium]